MKQKIIVALGLILGLSTTANAQKKGTKAVTGPKIQVEVKNKPSDTLEILSRTSKDYIVVNKKGLFTKQLNLEEGIYRMSIGEQYGELYLTKNTNLQITVDYKDFDKTLSFKGSGAKENTFLVNKILNEEKYIEKAYTSTDETELTKNLDAYKSFIEGMITPDLDPNFVTKIKSGLTQNLNGIKMYVSSAFELKKLKGQPSPTFAFENHKGGLTKLEELKGKYVYIDVWATWCGPCRQEIPYLQKVEEHFHGKNIAFVSISVDEQKNKEKWSKFVTDKNLGGIQLLADKDWRSDFVQGYKIMGIPRKNLSYP